MFTRCTPWLLLLFALSANPMDAQEITQTPSAPTSTAQNVVAMVEVEYGSAEDMQKVLKELQLAEELDISAQPQSNLLVLRGPQEAMLAAREVLEELQSHAEQHILASQTRSFYLHSDTTARLRWSGGEGGLGPGPDSHALICRRSSSSRFRLSDIAQFPGLLVEIQVRTTAWNSEIVNALKASPEVSITREDLTKLNEGWDILKYVTGPHQLSTEHPQVFDVLTSQERKEAPEASTAPEDFVAVFKMSGITLPAQTATPHRRSAHQSPFDDSSFAAPSNQDGASPTPFDDATPTTNPFGENPTRVDDPFGKTVGQQSPFDDSSSAAPFNQDGASPNPFDDTTPTTNPFGEDPNRVDNPFGEPTGLSSQATHNQHAQPRSESTSHSTFLPPRVGASENEIRLTFEQLRFAQKNHLPPETISRLQESLRLVITNAFKIRQTDQLDEIRSQRVKLDTLEEKVQFRATQAEKIIEQRYQQLLERAKN